MTKAEFTIGSTDEEARDYTKTISVTGEVDARSRRTSSTSQSRCSKLTIRIRYRNKNRQNMTFYSFGSDLDPMTLILKTPLKSLPTRKRG